MWQTEEKLKANKSENNKDSKQSKSKLKLNNSKIIKLKVKSYSHFIVVSYFEKNS